MDGSNCFSIALRTVGAGLVLVLCTLGVQAADTPATTPAYFYDATGPRPIVAAGDAFLVAVDPGRIRTPGERPGFLPARVAPEDLHPAASDLETRMERRGLFVVRGADRAQLSGTAGVRWALPVLYRVGCDVPYYQTDRVIVAFGDDVAPATIVQLADELGCEARRQARGKGRYIFSVRDPQRVSPVAIANTLHEHALTRYAEPDFFAPKIALAPPVIQDPFYLSHQWHLDGDTLKGADANSDVNVESAWDTDNGPYAQGRPSVRVAILDDSVEKLHPDLYPNWATGRDYDEDPPDDDPSPDGSGRHGTSCAGVAVAAGNTIGVRGAAPNCELIGVRFFGGTIAQTAESFYFCMDPNDDGDHSDGASVMSNSWGFADGTLLPSDLATAINDVATNGRNGLGALILFASANNDHTVNGVTALAQLPTVMAIGGTNSHARHTEFSDVGPEVALTTPTNDRGDDGVRFSWLDITTTDNTGESGYNGLPDLDYTNQFGGTSSATPLAAGIMALILSQDPTMTAAQARAIAQHTAVRLDEPYGRFDGITGHSHRFGYGRAAAGAAVAAARAGVRWPDRIDGLSATWAGESVVLSWDTPTEDYADTLVVRSSAPFAWMPTDGETYAVSDVVAPGVEVIHIGALGTYTDPGATSGAFFYAVYPRSADSRWGFGAKAHVILEPLVLFADNSEQPPPGWTHGGAGNEWQRGTPTSANSIFGQVVVGSGPLAGLNGLRAINGDNCWGTDLLAPYNAHADAWLQTPLLNLTGVAAPVFLEYWDWCLLETYYDQCIVEAVDPAGDVIATIDGDTGGDYDWTRRVYDLSALAGETFHIRFRLVSDGVFQRDGWFLDEIRVVVAGNVALPPVADPLYVETSEDTDVLIQLSGRDPNPAETLDYVITTLPAHGTLTDPFGADITSVPYTLVDHGLLVRYTPDAGYQGPDSFVYHVSDGALVSNDAEVTLSVGTPVVAYDFPLNTDPGWAREGLWGFGIPQGQDGDPASAASGLYVFGYNLAGAYENDLPPRRLTTLPLNCTGLSRVTLSFARWLGVESANYDGASIEVTNDGTTWYTVWNHSGGTLEETAWSTQSYNVAAVADNQPFVQFRWTMGPTDAAEVYGGWNIDDVQVLAIGTPPTNQPPYARALNVSTAKDTSAVIELVGVDTDEDPLTYTILSLPENGTLRDPNGEPIVTVPRVLTGPAPMLTYDPFGGYAGADAFTYQVDDGLLPSNVATVAIEVLGPAPFPFTEDFEAGAPLDIYWFERTTSTGRIAVTDLYGPDGDYHLVMDSSYEGLYSLCELTLVVDLAGHSFVRLAYDWKDFSDEAHPLPDTWTDSTQGDGVAVSADGIHWHRIADLFDPSGARAETYQTVLIDLDQVVADLGLGYTNTFRIRFQQYDNNPVDSDGIALDNIRLIQGTADPVIATSSLPHALVDEPYEPYALTALGGDEPLTWSLLDLYGEEPLGTSQFAPVGVAQEWQGGNDVFDYTLPFAFPFYGELHTDVKIATDGWINFGPYVGATYNNSELLLSYNKRIAVLWDNLRTDEPGNDIFIDESVPGEVTIRWDAVTHGGLYPCAFSATLYDDGRIRCHYGPGNTNLTPTIGVSAGDQVNYTLSQYDGDATLTGAISVEFDQSQLPPGMMLDPAGTVWGTPTVLGRFKPVFHVADASQRVATRLVPIRVIADVFGDYDFDGDADMDDFEALFECWHLGTPTTACLETFDDDANGSLNLRDFAQFQRSYTGAAGE